MREVFFATPRKTEGWEILILILKHHRHEQLLFLITTAVNKQLRVKAPSTSPCTGPMRAVEDMNECETMLGSAARKQVLAIFLQ